MRKAVIVYSGGIDSVCCASYLKSKYELRITSYNVCYTKLLRLILYHVQGRRIHLPMV